MRYKFYRDESPEGEGNVIAVDVDVSKARRETYGDNLKEGFAGIFPRPNSPVSWTGIHPDVLGEQVTEEEARDIHPRLFDRIDQPDT